MLKKRLIPVLLLKNGQLVRSESFTMHQIIGDPIHEAKRFNEWNVDELIYLDITQGEYSVQRRGDHKSQGMNDPLEILETVSRTCFMPLTWGGRIRSFEDAAERFRHGADKITLNQALFDHPEIIDQVARRYGSQAVVASVDVQGNNAEGYSVVTCGRKQPTGKEPKQWAKDLENMGAGEILLQSVEQDGMGEGYDTDLIHLVASAVKIPVIACSGVGTYEDYAEGIRAGASAVAAANIWHFKELSDKNGKRALQRAGVNIRF